MRPNLNHKHDCHLTHSYNLNLVFSNTGPRANNLEFKSLFSHLLAREIASANYFFKTQFPYLSNRKLNYDLPPWAMMRIQ